MSPTTWRPHRTGPTEKDPASSASAKASHAPIIDTPNSILLQILAAWPAPPSPQCTPRLPIMSKNGSPLAKAASDPPTIKVRLPASAPTTPPDTGASRHRTPAASARLWSSRAVATSIVEQSIRSAPSCMASSTSAATASTMGPSGNIRMTISASAPASALLVAISRPFCVAASRALVAHIVTAHFVAGALQIEGHGNTHVSQADKADLCHIFLSSAALGRFPFSFAERRKHVVDHLRRDLFQRGGPPIGLPVLVDHHGANSLEELMPRERAVCKVIFK